MADLYLGDSFPKESTSELIDLSSATVTLAPSSFIYDGSTKTQTVTSVVLNNFTLTENVDYSLIENSKINAGSYPLYVMGKGDYTGIAVASSNWNIAKVNGSVSLSKNSVELDAETLSDTITVTRAGNGTISATSSDINIATVSVSGAIVTITAVGSGETTITVNVAAGTNYNAVSTTANVSVTLIPVLNQCTPAEIQQVAQAGTGSQYWSVGDKTEEISISTVGNMSATSTCAFILGFDHNSSKEGTGIHFQFGKTTGEVDIALVDSGCNVQKTSGTWFNMNNSRSNSGGWNGSRMRTTICSTFLSALPSAWQSVIASTTKYTDNTGGGSDNTLYVTSTSDKIWLLAEYEVFGARANANSAEQNYQTQYSYYKNGNSKVKYMHNSISSTCTWWLRSPVSTVSGYFCRVGTNGNVSGTFANYSLGFAPGFRVA